MTENVCQTKQGYTNASLNPEVIRTGGVPTEENGYTDYHGFVPYIYNIDQYNAEHGTHYQSPLGVLCQNQENCKRKSVDNSRTYNAFALTARIDYNPLIPRVPLRFTLGYSLLRLQRYNYRHELRN